MLLPSSGSFFGPKTKTAITRITSRVHRLKQPLEHSHLQRQFYARLNSGSHLKQFCAAAAYGLPVLLR